MERGLRLLAGLCSDDGGPQGEEWDAGDRDLARAGDRMADRVRILLAELSLEAPPPEGVVEVDQPTGYGARRPSALGGTASALGRSRFAPPGSRLATSGYPPSAIPSGSVIVGSAVVKDLVAFVDTMREGYAALAGVCGRAKAARARLAKELTYLRVLQDRGVLVETSPPATATESRRQLQHTLGREQLVSAPVGGHHDSESVGSLAAASDRSSMDYRGTMQSRLNDQGKSAQALRPSASSAIKDAAKSARDDRFHQLMHATATLVDPAAQVRLGVGDVSLIRSTTHIFASRVGETCCHASPAAAPDRCAISFCSRNPREGSRTDCCGISG